ncbi:SSI family serine proteinase inhibitor [Glycomyces harbinensis]|uniref:Subtilisin inhibitor-like n=1 Tax=Glycomyces harbinensis TaxID=58114 RepID=A0A1G7BAE2_9ACTN|nr:SSI family serine proteinase inhibitor [Glycomyces harbinensis]SDE23981.1 Subtilisin inhibitor-like [Glycomyces harbinensis]
MKQLSVGAAIAAAAAFVALSSAPAQALSLQEAQPMPVDPGIGDGGAGLVFLSVSGQSGENDARALLCPDGQGHAQGFEACTQLTAAGGDLEALNPVDGFCTKEYAPVTFRAFGVWEEEFVSYEHEFSNYCTGLHATGGAVFDLS